MKTSELISKAKAKVKTLNQLRFHEMIIRKGKYLVILEEYAQGVHVKRHMIEL